MLQNLGIKRELNSFLSPAYRKVFDEILPGTMDRLLHDQSPEAIADASVVYNMFAEGVLAETGYWDFYESLAKINKMPGLLQGVSYIKRDESRHIGFGTFLLQRLISENDYLLDYILNKLHSLMPIAIELSETMRFEEVSPFGIKKSDSQAFMVKQLNARVEVLKRAQGKTLEEIYRTEIIFD